MFLMGKLVYRVVVFQILLLCFICFAICCVAEKFSASFIFGDSLVEAGNNNYITTLSKANYPPNGIDFGKPTGRYTNGRHITDILGFENANSACCYSVGRHGGIVPCGPGPSVVCPDRSKYLFWDAYHTSDAAITIVAKRLMDGSSDDISPINLRQFVQLAR